MDTNKPIPDKQHDAHMDTRDQQVWRDWKPEAGYEVAPASSADKIAINTALMEGKALPAEVPSQYVISKSDSVEHLYWRAMPLCGLPAWGKLEHATRWTHVDLVDLVENKELQDGFWMPLERAEELDRE